MFLATKIPEYEQQTAEFADAQKEFEKTKKEVSGLFPLISHIL